MRTGPSLQLQNVNKTFSEIPVLQDVNLTVRPGEVHGLVGANGSGKSTLIKVLAGFHRADSGSTASYGGVSYRLDRGDRPFSALRFVHQDSGILPELSAMDNFALLNGYPTNGLRLIDWSSLRDRVLRVLHESGVDVDVDRPMESAPPVARTLTAIAAATFSWQAAGGVLVLDEPTAAFNAADVERLRETIKRLTASRTSVLYVSHRLDEIFEFADRVSVLRGGRCVATTNVSASSPRELAEMMIGAPLETTMSKPRSEAHDTPAAPIALGLRDVSGGFLRRLSLTVRRGEILGIAGLQGSGREDLIEALTLPAPKHSGVVSRPSVWVGWRRLTRKLPALPAVPADRLGRGVVAGLSVSENLTLSYVDALRSRGLISRPRERALVAKWIRRLGVVAESSDSEISQLSGGNQQKVVIGRWLLTEPDVLILDDPTAGVDVGARESIYNVVHDSAEAGMGVLVSSSDTEDLVRLCDRVLVLRDGEIYAELSPPLLTTSALHHAMEGTDYRVE